MCGNNAVDSILVSQQTPEPRAAIKKLCQKLLQCFLEINYGLYTSNKKNKCEPNGNQE